MGIYSSFNGAGNLLGFLAGMITNTQNFSVKHKGKISGLMFASLGISAAFITEIYYLFFNGNLDGFFLYVMSISLGILPLFGIILVGRVSMNIIEEEKEEEEKQILIPKHEQVDTLTFVPKFGEFGGLTILRKPPFILLISFLFMIAGSGLMFIGNVGELVKSLQITELEGPSFVIILSFGNCFGRLLFGYLVDVCNQKQIPLACLLVPIAAMLSLSHFLLSFFGSFIIVVFCTFFTTLSYGGMWATFNTLINRYFGDKYFASNSSYGPFCAGFAAMSFNFFAGILYDLEVLPENKSTHQCYGQICYHYIFLITGSCCFLIMGVAILLSIFEYKGDKIRKEILKNGGVSLTNNLLSSGKIQREE